MTASTAFPEQGVLHGAASPMRISVRFALNARPAPVPHAGRRYSDRVARVCDFIAANLEASLHNDELASVACLSTAYFARRFKAETGVTPGAYLRRARFEEAKRLLEETDLPIAEIAYRCGFCSQSHMTVVFGVEGQMTPKKHRDRSSVRRGALRTRTLGSVPRTQDAGLSLAS